MSYKDCVINRALWSNFLIPKFTVICYNKCVAIFWQQKNSKP